MISKIMFTLDIYLSRIKLLAISRKISIRISLKQIMSYNSDLLKKSDVLSSIMYESNIRLPFGVYSNNEVYLDIMKFHKLTSKHHIESILYNKDLTDSDLAMILANMYLESNNFGRAYRDAEFLYRNSYPEYFIRFDKIIYTSELFS